MRILYFSSRECWPPNTGARLRDYHLARELAQRAKVTYFGLRNPGDPAPVEPPPESRLEQTVLAEKGRLYSRANLVRGILGPVPVTVLNCRAAGISSALRRTLASPPPFATVQVEGMHLAEYLPLLRRTRPAPALVADWHNVESEIMWRFSRTTPGFARKLYARRTASLIEGMERRLLRGCEVHVVTSSRERDLLQPRLPEARIEVVGNGVDVAHHSDAALDSACLRAGREPRPVRSDILFVGSMDYHANGEAVTGFAADTWPALRARNPDLRFVIVGRNPPPAVTALARLPGVEVTGTVDDVRPWYRSARAVVVPLKTGSGTRLKILEAMAAGVPVVSTRLGAEGLDVTDGVDILLAETARETIAAVESLSDSSELRRGMTEAARELVRRLYDWPILGERLFAIHQSVNPERT